MTIYSERRNVVYWLYNEFCTDPMIHGYVGITNNLPRRLGQHRKRKRIPDNFQWKILFEGTRDECLQEELRLRPDCFVGWNVVVGGRNSGREFGYKHKPETIEKIRQNRFGFVVSKDTKEKISQTLTGGHLSETTKTKLYNRWRQNSIFTKEQIDMIRNDPRGSRTLAKDLGVDRKSIIKVRKRIGIYSDNYLT